MKPSMVCLSESDIPLLLSGDLPPDEIAAAERHLKQCETCRSKIESMIADSYWWDEAQESLAKGALQVADCPLAPDDAVLSSNDPLLDLLGPTDNPTMLGRIGVYEIVGILGRGGMGAVFKGYDAALNRFVAVKMLLPHLAASGAARQRFAREAQAAAAVVDDHVMAIHGVSQWNSIPYFVMPYSRGISLQKRLSQEGPLELREILRIGMQSAKGLAAAHSQGLVHRDIKPANIFLDEGVERVQLMDFGLARAVDDASMTRTGVIAGTPQYMSPEQARAETIDHRSDLFSLGSVLYAMCVGHAPFRAESSYSVLRLISDKEPRSIREVNSDIPEWLCAIIGKLMSKQPDDRFHSAEQVAELFESCLAHVHEPTTIPLPAPVAELADTIGACDEGSKPIESRGGFGYPPIPKSFFAAALAVPLLLAGVFIALEPSEGTITIKSDADEVPIIIKKDGQVYEKVTIGRDGKALKVKTGAYEVVFDGEFDEFTIHNGNFKLGKGEELVIQIKYATTKAAQKIAAIKRVHQSVLTFSCTARAAGRGVRSSGMGWVVGPRGTMVAPAHCFPDTWLQPDVHVDIRLQSADGRTGVAKLVRKEGSVAVLESDLAHNIAPLHLADSGAELNAGESVLAFVDSEVAVVAKCRGVNVSIPNPKFNGAVGSGPMFYHNCIQTNLSSGANVHSGAPLLTNDGRIAGMLIKVSGAEMVAIRPNALAAAVASVQKVELRYDDPFGHIDPPVRSSKTEARTGYRKDAESGGVVFESSKN